MKSRANSRIATATCMLVIVSGCGDKKPSPPQQAKTENLQTDETAKATLEFTSAASSDAADISGRITLKGDLPGPRKLSITKDVDTCGAVDTIVDVQGKDGGVANVVIEVKGVTGDDWTFEAPSEGYVFRQKDCQFKPNLVVMPFGKQIKVFNDDPVGHNVNTGDWNQMQPAGPDPIVKPVENKAPTKIGCNIHSWMEAWIYPVQNPYFAVTSESGEFKIKEIPPGKYRINIWHAALGRKTARLTLEAGKVATLDHEFEVK